MNYTIKTIIILTVLISSSSCKNETKSTNSQVKQRIERQFTKEGVLELKNNGDVFKTLDIEFAKGDYETSEGLKHRYYMEEDKGMLFLFPTTEMKNFWMQDTRIPLDILYIKEDSIVLNIAKNSPPMTEYGINGSIGPVKFVLEINGGMSDKWGIIEGKTKLHWKKSK